MLLKETSQKIGMFEQWLLQHGKIASDQCVIKQLADYQVCVHIFCIVLCQLACIIMSK